MIIHADCILAMSEMEPSSIDAIVTDPPYGLEFMGKEWDSPKSWDKRDPDKDSSFTYRPKGGNNPYISSRVNKYQAGYSFQAWVTQWATEALRVLKPGGSLLSFGGTRTHHRLTCGLEDSGFIIKDCLMWLYGQGFPKAQDLGKMIDKRLGAEREVVGSRKGAQQESTGRYGYWGDEIPIDTPASDLARHWDGYKIGGIKPSWEPIIWAVKPPEGAWIDNVLKYGTGAVNVDECRIGTTDQLQKLHGSFSFAGSGGANETGKQIEKVDAAKGRFPANLLLDESAARLLDEQSGVCGSSSGYVGEPTTDEGGVSWRKGEHAQFHYSDNGGASRFFYTSKAQNRDSYNDHPTLKPTDLIEWLIRLVTRPGQTVLDCFAGSGTTGVAAIQSGREFILIEQDEHYVDICERRTTDGAQQGMF